MFNILFDAMSDTDDSGVYLRPPKPLKLAENQQNWATAWQQWLRSFEWYATATNLSRKKPLKQIATFMTVIGPDALAIYDTFKLNDEQKNDLNAIKQSFNAYFTPKVNKTIERLLFNRLFQKSNQPFDEFLTIVINQANKCAYGELRDELICDKIVVGISDDGVRKKLLTEEELGYDRAVAICKAAELANKHPNEMKGDGPVIHTLKNNKKKDEEPKTKTFHCKRCGAVHGPRSCPANKKQCTKCQLGNHLANVCASRKAEAVTKESEAPTDESIDLYVTSVEQASSSEEEWFETSKQISSVEQASSSEEEWFETSKQVSSVEQASSSEEEWFETLIFPGEFSKRAEASSLATKSTQPVDLPRRSQITSSSYFSTSKKSDEVVGRLKRTGEAGGGSYPRESGLGGPLRRELQPPQPRLVASIQPLKSTNPFEDEDGEEEDTINPFAGYSPENDEAGTDDYDNNLNPFSVTYKNISSKSQAAQRRRRWAFDWF